MKIEKLPRYLRDVDKIVKLKKLSLQIIQETEELFLKDPYHKDLRLHPIKYKHDKYRYSVTVIKNQYRILLSLHKDKAVFRHLLNHDKYDRMNKNC